MAISQLNVEMPIYETYEKHVRAQRKDRIKNFPGEHLTTVVRYDRRTFRNFTVKVRTGFPLHENPTTSEYVRAYCEANNLVHEEHPVLSVMDKLKRAGRLEVVRVREVA